jgi:hypothetical protein
VSVSIQAHPFPTFRNQPNQTTYNVLDDLLESLQLADALAPLKELKRQC